MRLAELHEARAFRVARHATLEAYPPHFVRRAFRRPHSDLQSDEFGLVESAAGGGKRRAGLTKRKSTR